MKFKQTRVFYLLAGLLFLLNLVQAYYTDLIYDEAYYWYYSKALAWGYFDHPPMVAFLIKLGSYFFEGEIGVRLMSCVFSVGTLYFIW
ncbi:MAG: 4-amino-4-deoxy-L-arabinose transferase, partial [Flavobacteriaceae bacterium]